MRDKNGLQNMIKTVFLPIAIYYLVHQMAALFLLGMPEHLGWTDDTGLWSIFARMLAMIMAGLSVYSFYNKAEKKKSLTIRNVAFIVLAGIVFSLGLNYLFSVTGFMESSESYNRVAQIQFSYALLPALIFYGVVSPVVEELVFRGIVYSSLKRYWPQIPAMIGSALLFGAVHGNIVQILYGTIMGIIMAVLYEKYENLLAPIFFHGAANAAVYICTYLVI